MPRPSRRIGGGHFAKSVGGTLAMKLGGNNERDETMKELKKITACVAVVSIALLAGCDSRPEMRKTFSRPRILTDSTGGVWIVEHNEGWTYVITPMPKD